MRDYIENQRGMPETDIATLLNRVRNLESQVDDLERKVVDLEYQVGDLKNEIK